MYHIYLDEEAVNNFAARLAGSRPFRDGTYTLYADVPVKCLGYESPYFTSLQNLSTMDSAAATQTVDFLVVKGTDVMLGITTEVMAGKSRKLFETVLKPIPHIASGSGGEFRQKYRRLYHKVRDALEELEENPYPCFSLTPFPVELSVQELKHKRLLQPNGTVSAYGRAHGLFFRYQIGQDGNLERHPVSSTVAFQDYLRASNWERSVPEDGDYDALQALLEVPMGELYRNHSESWNELNDIMMQLRRLQSYPNCAPDNILEDYLELVLHLRCRVADENAESRQILNLTEKLLICIGEVLSDERTGERFAALRMPLRSYFEEAALRSGLYYPEWLFRQAVSPFLNDMRFRGTYTLQHLLLQRSCLPANTPFPTLMELLVLPHCNPEGMC